MEKVGFVESKNDGFAKLEAGKDDFRGLSANALIESDENKHDVSDLKSVESHFGENAMTRRVDESY